MEKEIYRLNDNLIYREEDKTFFSLKKMEIYKMDNFTYKILNEFVGKSFEMEELYQKYINIDNIDIEYFDEFISILKSKNIIVTER